MKSLGLYCQLVIYRLRSWISLQRSGWRGMNVLQWILRFKMYILIPGNLFCNPKSTSNSSQETYPRKRLLQSILNSRPVQLYGILTISSKQNGNEHCLNSVKTKLAVIFWRNCRKPLYYKLEDYLRTSSPHDVRLQMPALASPAAWTSFNSAWLSVACCIRQNLTKANYLPTRGANKQAPAPTSPPPPQHTRCNS